MHTVWGSHSWQSTFSWVWCDSRMHQNNARSAVYSEFCQQVSTAEKAIAIARYLLLLKLYSGLPVIQPPLGPGKVVWLEQGGGPIEVTFNSGRGGHISGFRLECTYLTHKLGQPHSRQHRGLERYENEKRGQLTVAAKSGGRVGLPPPPPPPPPRRLFSRWGLSPPL